MPSVNSKHLNFEDFILLGIFTGMAFSRASRYSVNIASFTAVSVFSIKYGSEVYKIKKEEEEKTKRLLLRMESAKNNFSFKTEETQSLPQKEPPDSPKIKILSTIEIYELLSKDSADESKKDDDGSGNDDGNGSPQDSVSFDPNEID